MSETQYVYKSKPDHIDKMGGHWIVGETVALLVSVPYHLMVRGQISRPCPLMAGYNKQEAIEHYLKHYGHRVTIAGQNLKMEE